MSKPFLDKMSKEERQAFSYLENLIIQSKIECLKSIPKSQIYNDSEIKARLESHESRLSSIKTHNNLMHEIETRLMLELRMQKVKNEVHNNLVKQIAILENSVENLIDIKFWNQLVDAREELMELLQIEENVHKHISDFIEKSPIDIALIQKKKTDEVPQ